MNFTLRTANRARGTSHRVHSQHARGGSSAGGSVVGEKYFFFAAAARSKGGSDVGGSVVVLRFGFRTQFRMI